MEEAVLQLGLLGNTSVLNLNPFYKKISKRGITVAKRIVLL